MTKVLVSIDHFVGPNGEKVHIDIFNNASNKKYWKGYTIIDAIGKIVPMNHNAYYQLIKPIMVQTDHFVGPYGEIVTLTDFHDSKDKTFLIGYTIIDVTGKKISMDWNAFYHIVKPVRVQADHFVGPKGEIVTLCEFHSTKNKESWIGYTIIDVKGKEIAMDWNKLYYYVKPIIVQEDYFVDSNGNKVTLDEFNRSQNKTIWKGYKITDITGKKVSMNWNAIYHLAETIMVQTDYFVGPNGLKVTLDEFHRTQNKSAWKEYTIIDVYGKKVPMNWNAKYQKVNKQEVLSNKQETIYDNNIIKMMDEFLSLSID